MSEALRERGGLTSRKEDGLPRSAAPSPRSLSGLTNKEKSCG